MNGAGLWMAGLWLTPFLTVVLSLRELFNPCGCEASEVQVRKWRVGEVRRVDQGPQLVHGEVDPCAFVKGPPLAFLHIGAAQPGSRLVLANQRALTECHTDAVWSYWKGKASVVTRGGNGRRT